MTRTAGAMALAALAGVGAAHGVWPVAGGGPGPDAMGASVTDELGNTYAVGSYSGRAFFGSFELNSAGLTDVFVTKISPNGEVLWAATAGGPSLDEGLGITLDPGGNIYVTGFFSKTAQFKNAAILGGPALGSITLPNPAAIDVEEDDFGEIFVGKLEPDGEWDWVAQVGDGGTASGGAHDVGYSLAFVPGDATSVPPTSDGVVVAGRTGCARLTDGDGDFDDSFETALGCESLPDAFLGKLDTFGNWEWVKLGGEPDTEEYLTDLVSTPDGTLYADGVFFASTSIGGNDLISSGATDVALSFWHRYRTEAGFDGGVLEYSVDGGFTWHDIEAGPNAAPSGSNFLENGYNSTLNTGFHNPLPGRRAWSGDSVGFVRTQVNISRLAGLSVKFRFRFGADSSVSPSGAITSKGWWIDDFEISNSNGSLVANDFEGESCTELFNPFYVSGTDCTNWRSEPGPGNTTVFPLWPRPLGKPFTTSENTTSPVAHEGLLAMWTPDLYPGEAYLSGDPVPDASLDWFMTRKAAVEIVTAQEQSFFTRIIDAAQNNPTWEWVQDVPRGISLTDIATRDEGGNPKLFLTGKSTGAMTWGGFPVPQDGGVVAKYDVGSRSFNWVQHTTSGRLDGVVAEGGSGDPVTVAGELDGDVAFSSGDPMLAITGAGGLDVLVGQLSSNGTWNRTASAGGSDDDRGVDVSLSPDGTQLYVSGVFMDMATFGDRPLSTDTRDTSVFVANLEAADLTWFFQDFQTWFVGDVVPRPPESPLFHDIALDNPEIILDNAPGDRNDYFFYSPFEEELYAIQPVSATIRWRTEDLLVDPNNVNAFETVGQAVLPGPYCGTPATDGMPCRQLHIAGAPVEIQPPGVDLTFSTLGVFSSRGNNFAGGASPDSRVVGDPTNPEFRADKPGFSVLVYVEGNSPDFLNNPVLVRVIETVRLDTTQDVDGDPIFTDMATCTVGTPVAPHPGHNEPGRTGYVLSALAMFDGTGPDAAYDREARTGTIIPVNEVNPRRTTDLDGNGIVDQQMAVAWYHSDDRGIFWPDRSVRYDCRWPLDPDRIIVASQLGSEALGQEILDPASFPSLRLYVQNDPNLPGFNPNDEHAFFAPSNLGSGVDALFAVRADFALSEPNLEASKPFSLVKYFDPDSGDWAFKIYRVQATGAGFNTFRFTGTAGGKINPPYPVSLLGGCPQTAGSGDPFFLDYQNNTWAKAAGEVRVFYWYPLQPSFHYDRDFDNQEDVADFDCVPWMDQLGPTPPGQPIEVVYSIDWPADVPILTVGETLLEPKRGLPDIFNQAAAEVVFDEIDPDLQDPFTSLGKLIDPISPRKVRLLNSASEAIPLPSDVAVENEGGNQVIVGSADGLIKLPFTVRSRILFDPLDRDLIWRGVFDDSGSGEPLLLLNVMSNSERILLKSLSTNSAYLLAVDRLFVLSRNPQLVNLADSSGARDSLPELDKVLVGFQDRCYGNFCRKIPLRDPNTGEILEVDGNPTPVIANVLPFGGAVRPEGDGIPEPLEVLGVNGALTAGDAPGAGFLTLAFNNDPTLAPLPVSLEVIRVDCLRFPEPPEEPVVLSPYQGEVLVVESDNVFDEQLVLRHSGDFGGLPENFDFEWYSQFDTDGTPPTPLPDPENGQLNGWLPFPAPTQGASEITVSGPTLQTLSDNWFVVRYKRRRPPGDDPSDPGVCQNKEFFSVFAGKGGTPLEPRAQLAEGWIKRVVRGLNPFEARVRDFHEAEVNTIVSMISQLGERYEGDIAFNPAASNVNQVGLIEAYETVLRRGMDLSVSATPPVNFGPANNALLLVASRIADFYTLLGNEAYTDALDPMIGFGTQSGVFGSLAPTIFAFENQLDSLLEEELVLLRGRDNSQGPVTVRPVYNRLFWNFTSGDGEVAYTQAYNVSDEDFDGFIDENDGKALYPQGHGDAWGHYLTALDTYYKLLRHPFFTWVPRPEAVLVSGVPIQVDFLDERKFARAAAAKARAGADIVDLTYRLDYVEDPAGQWQGYKDTDPERAWGLMEWGRRAGQGAYFDWVVGNSILPDEDPDPDHHGIQRVDRTTVEEFDELATLFVDIQQQVDDADRGLNPLGLAKGVVPFDIDPSFLRFDLGLSGKTHFEQIYDRAIQSLKNTVTVWDHANQLNELLRRNQDTIDDMRANVADTETELRNRLIEIFGYPYSDDIGPGGTYPDGYEGPDLYHFMYIDQSDLTGTPEKPVQVFTAAFEPRNREDPFYGFDKDKAVDRFSLVDRPVEKFQVKYHTRSGNVDSFFLIKPPEWIGSRRAPGELQDRLSDLLVALNDYEIAVEQYDLLIKEIESKVDGLKREHDILAREITIQSNRNATIFGLDTAINVAKGIKIALKRTAKVVEGAYKAGEECVPKNVIVGFATGGDLLSGARCGIKTLGNTTKLWLDLGQDIADGSILAMEIAKGATALATDIELNVVSANADIISRVGEIQALVRQEPTVRLEAFGKREIVEQERGNYLVALAKGQRVLADLVAFRQKTAGDIQEYRYQDLTFRAFRNDALEKYRAQFDLAARYAFLAATAYDYETNLLGSHPQAGQEFLTEIVRQRSLGQLIDGTPIPGSQGLADVLARLNQNFQVLKGQLGFNNPAVETTRFSLRRGLFRLRQSSDTAWHDLLEEHRVPNLFDVSGFRRFARPFAPESGGPQPGLVIPFSTTVNFGLNFFGFPLGPGDSAYDPSKFATRIRSVGVWLENYDSLPLSATPRVYLIPVGADVLRSPSAGDFTTREWEVVDQVLPVPFPIGGADLSDPDWIPEFDTLSGFMGETRRFSAMRAYALAEGDDSIDLAETTTDSRLVGRSVWNTQWLLLIPGGTMLFDPEEGLDTLIHGQLIPGDPDGLRDGNGISDIQIFFSTYAFEGN